VAERAPLGSALALALGRPFLTDLQRTAWHVGVRDVNAYLRFVPPEGDALSLGVERRLWDVGGVRRIGVGRDIAFIGFLLTQEAVTPASRFVVVSDSGLVADTSGALGGSIPAYRNRRLNAVVGLRALSFLSVRGFDALTAVQDVAIGVQVGTLIADVLRWTTGRRRSTRGLTHPSLGFHGGRREAGLVHQAARRACADRERGVRRWTAPANPVPTQAR
jgi:hypothetical protein